MKPGDIVAAAKATFRDFQQDDIQGAAAQVAYHFLFAIVPLLIFVTALAGFVSHAIGVQNTVDSITRWLFDHIGSAHTAETVRDTILPVVENQSSGVLSAGAVLALWGGKGAMGALIKGLNTAYDVRETRSWFKRTAVAIGLTIALGFALIAASTFFLEGSALADRLASAVGLSQTWATLWSILRWPLIVVMLVVALAFLYWAGPNARSRFRWVTPGSVLAVIGWGLATYGLKIYFSHFAGYVTTYGALGGILAFIFWVYVMSMILLIGGELNAVLERCRGESGRTTPRPKRQPEREVLDSPAPVTTRAPDEVAVRATAALSPSAASAERRRRFRAAVSTLVVAVVAAATAAIVRMGRRWPR